MRGTHSRLNHEQQVKVVIRLKPQQSDLNCNKCVYLSEQENQLVVSTDNKQEIFVFDHVAHQATSQLDIYRMIGQEAVHTSLEGYNCCLFAYGQTGAGKTYSIMGDINHLLSDFYCESRGILPRLIQDIFQLVALQTASTFKITCSYIEIYNEQIFDLLSSDKRVHQIRQDHKKGVFVEGVVQRKLTTYKQGIEALLQGDKTRKIAYTSMNTQSSRSHAIFTIMIESEVKEDELIKVKKSKLNIIDLAGSERVKHTNVEGERLREGCNINKSLHVLGNVINSLVQSTKKKKHIPYRDSKLTYYLKDSLGGNSITKLLANVHSGKEYYGDTISTLMFAKRAKILKTRVEVNQNLTENFDSLRKEVRRLREQLAEARYFKDIQKTERTSFYQDFQQTLQKVTDNSDYEVAPKIQIIQVFEENELHYKSLIEIYEEHIKNCHNHGSLRKNSLNMVGQRKNNEKKMIALTNLVQQFPAFTKIYKENILLKQQKQKSRVYEQTLTQDEKNMSKKIVEETTFITIKQPQNTAQFATTNIQQLVKVYEAIIDEMKVNFSTNLQALQRSYTELEHELKIKEKKIKSLIKAQDVPPDIQQLRNQNEYLQLNILNLQNQIKQLRENELKLTLDKKQMKKTSHRSSIKQKEAENQQDESTLTFVLQQLSNIKQQAQRQAQIAEKEREQMENLIHQLRVQVTSLVNQNNKLNLRYTRSGSQSRKLEAYHSHRCIEIQSKHSFASSDFPKQQDLPQKNVFSFQHEQEEAKRSYEKELTVLRLQIKMNTKQIFELKQQIKIFQQKEEKVEQQFGKDINEVLKDYRQTLKRIQPVLKPMKSINKFKEPEPYFLSPNLPNKVSDKIVQKKSLADVRTLQKQTPRNSSKKQVDFNNFVSVNHNKPKNNVPK